MVFGIDSNPLRRWLLLTIVTVGATVSVAGEAPDPCSAGTPEERKAAFEAASERWRASALGEYRSKLRTVEEELKLATRAKFDPGAQGDWRWGGHWAYNGTVLFRNEASKKAGLVAMRREIDRLKKGLAELGDKGKAAAPEVSCRYGVEKAALGRLVIDCDLYYEKPAYFEVLTITDEAEMLVSPVVWSMKAAFEPDGNFNTRQDAPIRIRGLSTKGLAPARKIALPHIFKVCDKPASGAKEQLIADYFPVPGISDADPNPPKSK